MSQAPADVGSRGFNGTAKAETNAPAMDITMVKYNLKIQKCQEAIQSTGWIFGILNGVILG